MAIGCKYMNIKKKLAKYERIIIWGDGTYGKIALHTLIANDLGERVICFTKSDRNFIPYMVDKIPVYSIYDLSEEYENTLFLIAVSQPYYVEIEKLAKKLNVCHILDSRKFTLESFPKNKMESLIRSAKKKVYIRKECGIFRHGTSCVISHVTYPYDINAGDTYLSWCIRKYFGVKAWNIITITDPVTNDIIHKINQTDLLIIGGGGLFLPDTNKNTNSGWIWSISQELLSQIDVPIVLYAVGYNYFPGQEPSELFIRSVNNLVQKADFIGMRSNGSVRALQKILKPELREKVKFQPCTTTIYDKMICANMNAKTKIVAVNMAFDRVERRLGNQKEYILAQVAQAIKQIENGGYKIVYVAHCDNDLEFLEYLDRANVDYKKINLTVAFPREILKFWNGVECSIGMRSHAQMIPFGLGKKIISLGSHEKIKWFMEDIDMMECYIDLNADAKTIEERIVNTFRQIMIDKPEYIEKKIIKNQDELWNISQVNKKKIMDLVDHRHT